MAAWPYSVAAIEAFEEAEDLSGDNNFRNLVHERGNVGDGQVREWKKLNSKELGISTSNITKPTRKVLNSLKQKGYEVYLVGGCVRDLLLKRTPKDFDIITSAQLKEVKKAFSWCEIVGKRFPICHVHVEDSIVEVSSFSTRQNMVGGDVHHDFVKPTVYDEKDYGRWRDCLRRDFTINSLIFDPYTSTVYDYLGGIEDLKKAKVRTVIPASISFQEDCARILRAIRIAARLGFRLSRETAHSVKVLSGSVAKLDKGRLLMEANYLLAYGSAEASLRLLWKFGLLEILLPVQSLFSNMDKLLAPDKPCHSSLWVAILAFHKALFDQPQDPLVVAAFSLALHNGGDVAEAVQIARRITSPHDASFHELLEPESLESQELIDEVMDLADCVKCALYRMTDEQVVSQAMAEYPKAPFSDLVLIPLGLYLRVCRVFECVRDCGAQGFASKQGSKIDYKSLAMGSLQEVRHVFARIVFDTVYPLKLTNDHTE
ncbi:Poly(A) polymerase [Morus notabilis]|uniref:Poly(A) polymerase n=1 Tax=Morus notabilis TaxID=981085 RepID=W9SQV8_9ROSA|nr:Poly(A) polymerase [Morus notabilis]